MHGETSPKVAKAESVQDAQADPTAFYRAHAEQLTRFATSLVGRGDAQDVVARANDTGGRVQLVDQRVDIVAQVVGHGSERALTLHALTLPLRSLVEGKGD